MSKIVNNSDLSNDSLVKSASANENGISTIFNYNGNNVTFKTEDGVVYINATQMAKPFNKRPNDYLALSSTNEIVKAITRKTGNSENQLVMTLAGAPQFGGGTWLHEDIAIDFAQWLSVDFRLWCNDRIKELLTTGKTVISSTVSSEELEVRKIEALNNRAKIFMEIGGRTSIPEFKQVIDSYTFNMLAGRDILPLPEVDEKTYSATEIGDILGVSANKIGKLANIHKMKTSEYGKFFYDKSRYSNKEVETFRYYEKAINKFKELIG